MANQTQNLANHARLVPGFHFVTAAITGAVLVMSVNRLVHNQGSTEILGILIALALVAQFWYIRAFPLAVQDRVIRLEEQLRLARHGLHEGDELTAGQLIGLRFASDAELPALVKKVRTEKITKRADIKALVKEWRPDHMRA